MSRSAQDRDVSKTSYWSFDDPVTRFGLSTTGALSPVTVSPPITRLLITVVPPALPVTVTGPPARTELTWTPAALPVAVTGPRMKPAGHPALPSPITTEPVPLIASTPPSICLLYTSDAADEEDS